MFWGIMEHKFFYSWCNLNFILTILLVLNHLGKSKSPADNVRESVRKVRSDIFFKITNIFTQLIIARYKYSVMISKGPHFCYSEGTPCFGKFKEHPWLIG